MLHSANQGSNRKFAQEHWVGSIRFERALLGAGFPFIWGKYIVNIQCNVRISVKEHLMPDVINLNLVAIRSSKCWLKLN